MHKENVDISVVNRFLQTIQDHSFEIQPKYINLFKKKTWHRYDHKLTQFLNQNNVINQTENLEGCQKYIL